MQYVKRDITQVDRGVIAQGVNCQHAMGSGVALAIMNKWPIVREKYMANLSGEQMLGSMHGINVGGDDNSLWVANCYTQEFCGSDGQVYADVDAIESSLRNAYLLARGCDINLFLPQIGAGLGGLDWVRDVEPIINQLDEEFETVETTICLWG